MLLVYFKGKLRVFLRKMEKQQKNINDSLSSFFKRQNGKYHLHRNLDTSSFLSAFLNIPVIDSFFTIGRKIFTNSLEYGGAIISKTFDIKKVKSQYEEARQRYNVTKGTDASRLKKFPIQGCNNKNNTNNNIFIFELVYP